MKNNNNSNLTTKSIESIINKQINTKGNFSLKKRKVLIDSLHELLNGNFVKYYFDNVIDETISEKISNENFIKTLGNINEKEIIRKKRGVYYTPKDLTQYIVANSFLNYLDKSNEKMHTYKNCVQLISELEIKKVENLLFKTSVFDPTCGAGEFLLTAYEMKMDILKLVKKDYTDNDVKLIVKTIYGNDINVTSIELTKIRLIFKLQKDIKKEMVLVELSKIINKNFSVFDFIDFETSNFKKYDICVGNPPYFELKKEGFLDEEGYGNAYAKVLHNVLQITKKRGGMGFVIPISYSSTSRMQKTREEIINRKVKQFVLNYADRPDCLFTSVHQKLCILLAFNGKPSIYTSSYKYWYKNERKIMLNGCSIIKNDVANSQNIVKIGNNMEKEIFEKILAKNEKTLASLMFAKTEEKIYLNTRATFWIKAFDFNPGSSEYKEYSVEKANKYVVLSLLNSSLFFFLWNVVSDCWHITLKDLSTLSVDFVISEDDKECLETIYKKLQNKLEQTKIYVNTKQTDYIYQHKECVKEIRELDYFVGKLYGLTENEIKYITNLNIKYRTSKGKRNE